MKRWLGKDELLASGIEGIVMTSGRGHALTSFSLPILELDPPISEPRKDDTCSRTNSATVRGSRPVRSACPEAEDRSDTALRIVGASDILGTVSSGTARV